MKHNVEIVLHGEDAIVIFQVGLKRKCCSTLLNPYTTAAVCRTVANPTSCGLKRKGQAKSNYNVR